MPLINQNIRILRKRMGLTQEKFAEVLGVKRSLIGAYEESRAVPPAENLAKLSQLFGVSVDQLLNHAFEKTTFGFAGFREEILNKNHPDENELKVSMEKKYSIEEKNNNLNNKSHFQPDLFSSANSDIFKNIANENNKIRYINNSILETYINKSNNIDFFSELPTLSLPFLPKGYLRAFDSPTDFLLPDCILIGERVENLELIKDGENHLLLTSLGLKYRRVYNQIRIKNALLLSSDKEGIMSEEVTADKIIEIWLVKSYISKSLPLPSYSLSGIQEKILDLKSEIDNIINRQAKP